jgi:hypothetical protein
MMRVYVILCLALLASVTLYTQGTSKEARSSGSSIAKEATAAPEHAQSPRAYVESRLGGKIIKVEKDPSDLLRAVLLVKRNGSVTRHVIETALDSERNLREVRIVTTEGNSTGLPHVIVIPPSLTAQCWETCKDRCGEGTECRVGCLFDCIVA